MTELHLKTSDKRTRFVPKEMSDSAHMILNVTVGSEESLPKERKHALPKNLMAIKSLVCCETMTTVSLPSHQRHLLEHIHNCKEWEQIESYDQTCSIISTHHETSSSKDGEKRSRAGGFRMDPFLKLLLPIDIIIWMSS